MVADWTPFWFLRKLSFSAVSTSLLDGEESPSLSVPWGSATQECACCDSKSRMWRRNCISLETVTEKLNLLHLSIFSKPVKMNHSVPRGFGGDPRPRGENVGIVQWLMCCEEFALWLFFPLELCLLAFGCFVRQKFPFSACSVLCACTLFFCPLSKGVL